MNVHTVEGVLSSRKGVACLATLTGSGALAQTLLRELSKVQGTTRGAVEFQKSEFVTLTHILTWSKLQSLETSATAAALLEQAPTTVSLNSKGVAAEGSAVTHAHTRLQIYRIQLKYVCDRRDNTA